MNLEGITLTQEMIENIRLWQEESGYLQSSINTFDKAISFIACESDGSDQIKAIKGLQLISSLCFVKEMVAAFGNKEG